tara:strand:- start:1719 stop:3161 length:1443 start_codon:yes stop_codon:yes gene_type:complete
MFSHKFGFKYLLIFSTSILGLSACTPSFKTTAQECITFSPVRLVATKTDDNSEFKVSADSPTNDYKLYLEDALNSLKGIQSKDSSGNLSSPISADENAAIQFILDKANEKMGYVLVDEAVSYSNNPLDYIESLIAATDKDEVIQTFIDAKENVARSIADNDSVCNYRNSLISMIVEDPEISPDAEGGNIIKTVNAQLDINFNPFNEGLEKVVDKIILISTDEPINEQSILDRQAKSFAGISRIQSDQFNAIGPSPSEIRQVTISDDQSNETFFFDDDFKELKLGQLISTHFNQTCTLRDENGDEVKDSNGNTTQAACPAGVTTRAIVHSSCQEETGQIQKNAFTIAPGNPALTDLQRLRLEVDYPDNEIRLYASTYAEKILKAGADIDNYDPVSDVIINPTRCEQQAVLDDLDELVTDEERNAAGFQGVRLTLIEDPNYDVKYELDEDGNQKRDDDGNLIVDVEPTPVFTFQGTAILSRQ